MTSSRTPQQIGKANRRAGQFFEHATKLALEAAGWLVQSGRAGGTTRRPVDLVAIPGFQRALDLDSLPWLVQCKSNGYVAPGERAELAELDRSYAAYVVVAYWHKEGRSARQVKFRHLDGSEVKP